ncbi:uncharacterized protein L201_004152 [Kwoniella dendrophila CBS 6074]|uniref:ARID domain-containing protein n=1 Tax=Kwoniella dendrophila CBS 6074 TaxID=1295534 RepID=A0AAX4JV99_9TREE
MEHGNESFSLYLPPAQQSPTKSSQPRRTATTSSPVANSPSSSPNHYLSSSTPGATSASSSATPSSQHPLAQPPITATSANNSPAPLPFLSLVPPQVNSLKSALTRRRSSYPPATTPGSGSAGNLFPWVMGGTPSANGFDWGSALETFPGFNVEIAGGNGVTSGANLPAGSVDWETLLNFDTEGKPSPNKIIPSNLGKVKPIIASPKQPSTTEIPAPRAKSDPLSDPQPIQQHPDPFRIQASIPAPPRLPHIEQNPTRVVQLGADLAWRTALASVVEVDGVGQITVARILQEVWRRGGGELVTSQCLWPSIVIALSMPSEPGPDDRVPNPSAQSAMALQHLYNLSVRHWEPVIFTGLLGAYGSGNIPNAPAPTESANAFAPTPVYGPSTPLREPDVSQWMNLTPSGWNTNALFGGNGTSENQNHNQNQTQRNTSGGFPFPMNADLTTEALSARRTSLAKTDNGEESNFKSIDEILASMEEGTVETERAMNVAAASQISNLNSAVTPEFSNSVNAPTQQSSTYQFPTPETDSSQSPPGRRTSNSKPTNTLSPVSMTSPYVTAGSLTSTFAGTGPSPIASSSPVHPHQQPQSQLQPHRPVSQKNRPSQLSMPPVEFIPPPPMCMFFKPCFESLTDGKAGIWRGDLEVRGRGGGKFPILVVGEKDTEHLWQSQLWPQTLTYPLNQHPVESCTSTMIPVSHLAREGLVPITMGMVLCNEPPERLAPYVNMVQGLHAEGVGFHLPCETRLPIVFLPAKFHSSDPLLRLGIAFMGKTGFSHPNAPLPSNTNTRGRIASGEEDGTTQTAPKKKRRRQSAPASATGINENNGKSRKRKDNNNNNGIIVMGAGAGSIVGKIDEEGE